MREAKLVITLAAAATVLLYGCSQSPNTVVPNGLEQNLTLRNPAILGGLKAAHAIIPRDLYVADQGTNAIDILHNKTFRDVGVITSGISLPVSVFLDARGNLYVANFVGNVAEYAPGNTGSPNFVYNSGIGYEVEAVTTDAHDNVFVADIGGNLTEYFQGDNQVIAQCNARGSASGIAVDSSGNVFASAYNATANSPRLVEYPGGLKNCNEITLSAPLASLAQGIALDKNDDILVAQGGQVVEIAPPYSSIAGTIGSGFNNAREVTLNRANTEAFVSDWSNETVTIVGYPGGSNITVLGVQNGLAKPFAAVDWPNAVY